METQVCSELGSCGIENMLHTVEELLCYSNPSNGLLKKIDKMHSDRCGQKATTVEQAL